ncbi:MAG: transcription termination factor Rho [Thermodesulfobacteriota bacterium]
MSGDIVHNPILPVWATTPPGGEMAGTNKKERKEKKEKPLEKWTIKEMREECLKIEGIQGVHGMNKEELLAHLREAKGIPAPVAKKTVSVREIKAKVRELRDAKRQKAEAGATRKQIDIARKKISRLKKLTRQAS